MVGRDNMRAAQFHAAGDIRIEDIPAPEPSDDRVLVEVEWCGICGSDLNEFIYGMSILITLDAWLCMLTVDTCRPLRNPQRQNRPASTHKCPSACDHGP